MFYIADNGKDYEERGTLFFHLPDEVPRADVDALLKGLHPNARVLCSAKDLESGADDFGDFPVIPLDFIEFDRDATDVVMYPGSRTADGVSISEVSWTRFGQEPTGLKWRRPARWRAEMFDVLSPLLAEIVFCQMRTGDVSGSTHAFLDLIRAEWFRRYQARRG